MKTRETRHPSETQLALLAGGDLGWWERRGIARHVEGCARCREELEALREGREAFRQGASESPAGIDWAGLSEEMTANIHVGLAAGECIAGFEKSANPAKPKLVWNAALVLACATVVVVCALWLDLPRTEWNHLMGALGQVRWSRIGRPVEGMIAAQEGVVLEASPAWIQLKENGATMSLLHPRVDGVTTTISTPGSAGARYVDDESGQVTINQVYYEQ
jgi:hypothetical protein